MLSFALVSGWEVELPYTTGPQLYLSFTNTKHFPRVLLIENISFIQKPRTVRDVALVDLLEELKVKRVSPTLEAQPGESVLLTLDVPVPRATLKERAHLFFVLTGLTKRDASGVGHLELADDPLLGGAFDA